MRQLTFRGFLTQYVRQLSTHKTNSLYQLAEEANQNNHRLREPLFLYAMYSHKLDVLLQAVKNSSLHTEYYKLASQYSTDEMTELLEHSSPALPMEYHKVWQSYQSIVSKRLADKHTKELMREKIKQIQEQSGVTNYRIYTDLGLNPGNLNAWLKHGNDSKVSLDTARRTLRYVESTFTKQSS